MDTKLRTLSLWIAGGCGALAFASIILPTLRPIDVAATVFAASVALLLFLRILFSPFYRRGINRANADMRGDAPWPGRRIKLFDPDWGIFGKMCGDPALLGVRAVLMTGFPLLAAAKFWVGEPILLLWFAAAFISLELSIMFAAISVQRKQS